MESPKKDVEYLIAKPTADLADLVERYYMVANHSNEEKEMTVIPDGRIDILFLCNPNETFTKMLLGIETQPSTVTFPANSYFFGISFKLLTVDYILQTSIADILNTGKPLPNDFLHILPEDATDIESFAEKASEKIAQLLKPNIDTRKQQLFDLIYKSNGSLTVSEYSNHACWSSRQINRYFNQTFGLSLKTYCNILRFRASFEHIKDGILYPQHYFSDQAHFAREVKKLAGVIPKELSKNKNDRFVQFSSLPNK